MGMFKAFYADQFVLPLPVGHRFPMQKYRLLRERVSQFDGVELVEAPLASLEQILLAHDADYVSRVFAGAMSPAEQREIGFPWSPEMVIRSSRSAGATIAAARVALESGISANLAGGTHHAYANKGSGFCVFNDAAIAARVMQQEFGEKFARCLQVAIVDLDVHQGNGTAAILQNDPSIFTFSIHGEKNFPFRKESSDLDIGLMDGCSDALYLEALASGLCQLERLFSPDLIIYLAGADPFGGDRLGRLDLTMDGLLQRDQIVFEWAKLRHLPIAIAMAGGYGRDITQTVAIHAQTIQKAITYQW